MSKLTTEEADRMIRNVTCEEIKKALFDIDDSKRHLDLMDSLLIFSENFGMLLGKISVLMSCGFLIIVPLRKDVTPLSLLSFRNVWTQRL